MTMTPAERTMRAKIAAHESWAKTDDRTERTANARRALRLSFEAKVDPDGLLPPAERARRGESARKAHYQRMAMKSAASRRRAKASPRPPSPPDPALTLTPEIVKRYVEPRPVPGRPRSFLYAIHCKATGLTKLGRSTDPTSRLAGLQTGSGYPLVILATVQETTKLTENDVHRRFSEHRRSGEWFDLSTLSDAEGIPALLGWPAAGA